MKEAAGSRPHIGGQAGPDRDREQHNVGGGKTRHAQGAQQGLAFVLRFIDEARRIVGHGTVAEFGEPLDDVLAGERAPLPVDLEPLGGKVDPRQANPRQAPERAFDLLNA